MATQSGVRIPPNVKLSAADREKVERLLGSDITLLGRHWEVINQCLNYKDGGQQYVEAADFVLEFTKFVRVGAFVSKLGQVLSGADLILGPIGNVIALMKASVSGREIFSCSGMTYGLTAWAFGHARPQPSRIRMKYLRESKPQESQLWVYAWNKGVDSMTRELERTAGGGPKARQTLRKVLRGVGENNPKTLNYIVAKSMEPKIRQIGGQAGLNNWRYFNDKYSYPA